MDIVDELKLANMQLKKTGIVRIAYFLLTIIVVIGVEIGLYMYCMHLIAPINNIPIDNTYNTLVFYEQVDETHYTLYSNYSGRWQKQEKVSEARIEQIRSAYTSANKGQNFINSVPSSLQLGIIDGWHRAAYVVILGLFLGFILEPFIRRRMNVAEVRVYLEMYDINRNVERFDADTIELIQEYKYYCSAPTTADIKLNRGFLAEKIIDDQKAEKRRLTAISNTIKARAREEKLLIKRNDEQKTKEQRAAQKKRQQLLRANDKKKVLENKKKQQETKEILMVSIPAILNIVDKDIPLSEEEKRKQAYLQKKYKKLVKQNRNTLREVVRQSSFMH